MAQVRWYLNATTIDGWQLLDQSAAGAATLVNGWVVGTGSTFSSEFASGAAGDRASTTFTANTVPDGTLDTTLKDAMRSQFAWTGNFAAGNWAFQFAVVSTVQSGAADGQIVLRILKADADGSNATEITSAQQATTIASNVAGTDVNITATVSLGAWTITNQYIFVQVAWKRTGAGGMTTTNIRLRTGSSATVGTTGLTGDFTPAVTTVAIASAVVLNVPTVANTQFVTGSTIVTTAVANGPTVEGVTLDQGVTAGTITPTSTPFAPELLLSFPRISSFLLVDQYDYSKALKPSSARSVRYPTDRSYQNFHASTRFSGIELTQQTLSAAADGDLALEIRAGSQTGTVLATALPVPVASAYDAAGYRQVRYNFATVDPLGTSTAYTWVLKRVNFTVDQPTFTGAGTSISSETGGTDDGDGGWMGLPALQSFFTRIYSESVFAPTVALAGAPDQGVTTQPIASTATLAVPSVAYGVTFQWAGSGYNAGPSSNVTAVMQPPMGGNRLLVVAVGSRGTQLPGAVSWGGTALTQVGNVSTADYVLSLWVKKEPAYSTNAVSVLWFESHSDIIIAAAQYSHVDQTTPYGTLATANGTISNILSTWIATTTVAAAVGDLIAAATYYIDGGSNAVIDLATNPFVSRVEIEGTTLGDAGLGLTDGVTDATSKLVGWAGSRSTLTAGFWGVVGLALKVAAPNATQTVAPAQFLTNTGTLYVPSVTGGAAGGDQSITGTTIGSTATLAVPMVAHYVAPTAGVLPISRRVQVVTRDVFRSRATFRRRRRLVVEGAPTGAQSVGGVTIASTIQTFALTVAVGAVTITAGTRPTTVALNAPAVTLVALGATIGSTSGTFAPTVAQTVLAVHRSTTIQVNVPTITVGPVAVTAGTRPTTIQVNTPTLAPGPVTVTTGTVATTAVVNAPILAGLTLGATIGSGSGTFAPTVALTVTTATISVASQVFLPSVALSGVLNVSGVSIATTIQVNVPTLAPGPVAVTTGTCATTITLNAPALTMVSSGATIGSASAAFAPSVALTVLAPTRATTIQIFAPTVALAITTGTSPTTIQVFQPSLALTVTTVHRGTTIQVNVPTLAAGPVAVTAGTVAATSQGFAPTISVGAITITAATIAPTSLAQTPSVQAMVLGATIGSTSGAFIPLVAYAVTTVHRATAISVNVPAVSQPGINAVGVEFIATGTVVRVPSLTTGPVTVVAGTCVATSQVFLPIVSLAGVVNVGAATVPTTAQVFTATITTGPVSVTAATCATTIQVFAPTVQALILGVTIGSGSGTFAPSVALTVTTGTRATTIQVFAPSVAPGPVTLAGATIAPTDQRFVPTVGVGAITVVGAHVATTAQTFVPALAGQIAAAHRATTASLFAPSLALGLTTAFIGPVAVLFAPVVLTEGGLGGPTAASTLLLFAPTLIPQAVTVGGVRITNAVSVLVPSVQAVVGGPTRATALQMNAPTVTSGAVTLVGGSVASAGQVFAPLVSVGATTIVGGTRPSTVVLFAPSPIATLDGTFITSTSLLFAPTVRPTQLLVGGTVDSTTLLRAATITPGAVTILGATRGSSIGLFPPTLVPVVRTVPIGATTQLFGATVAPVIGIIVVGGLPSTLTVFDPTVSKVLVDMPPEIHDFGVEVVTMASASAAVVTEVSATVAIVTDLHVTVAARVLATVER